MAAGGLLETNPVIGRIGHVSRTANREMVSTRDPSPNLPFEPSINLDTEEEKTNGLILLKREGEVRRDGNRRAIKKRRPYVYILMALVGRKNDSRCSNLLVVVRCVDEEAVVVDADPVVGVAGVEGDLEDGGEGVG